MSAVTLTAKHILHERNVQVRSAYFVTSGLVSLIVGFEDGFQVETGLVGCEGMIGVCLSHGIESEIAEAIVQTPGEALRIEASDLRELIETLPAFRRVVLGYSDVMRAQAMQAAACNGHHNLEQRLARWLLMTDDRSPTRDLPVTQEQLAMMLCVHRPSVTVVAGRLHGAGSSAMPAAR